MKDKSYLLISGSVFGVIAILHLFRLLTEMPIQIGTCSIPLWVSWFPVVFLGILCVWAYRLALPRK